MIVVSPPSSTIRIADRRFPAVGLICPIVDTEDRWERSLGTVSSFCDYLDVFIPLESGLLINVYLSDFSQEMSLFARTCRLETVNGEKFYVPNYVDVNDRNALGGNGRQFGIWHHCEEDWMVKHIDRLARMRYYEPPGQKAEIIGLQELVKIWEEHDRG